MKRGIVFAGGGARGAYEYGAWSALEALGEKFDCTAGTSIGSVNASLYVQHDYDKAGRLWDELVLDNVMTNAFLPDENDVLGDFIDHKNLVRSFFKTYVNTKGADISPFLATLAKYQDEARFLRSEIDYALVTIKFPSLTPVEVFKKDMKPGTYAHWVQTSCACFPIFPLYEFEGENYLDGGYYDNLPIASAFRMGAEHVTAIDLNYECGHPAYRHHPLVTYIHPHEDLGNIMAFDRTVTDRLRVLGYHDTMKVFGKYDGHMYTFKKATDRALFNALATDFVRRLTLLEIKTGSSVADFLLKSSVNAECTSFLCDLSGLERMSAEDYFRTALELAMTMFGYDTAKLYTYKDVFDALRAEEQYFYANENEEDKELVNRLTKVLRKRVEKRIQEIRGREEKREEMIILALLDCLSRRA